MQNLARVISFHYNLTTKEGQTIDSSREAAPFSFIEGTQTILPALEEVLLALKVGDKKIVPLKAAQAYGEFIPEMVMKVEKTKLPKDRVLQVGDQLQSRSPEGEMMILTVREILDDHVSLDANHPLAGVDLIFDVEMTGIRFATEEEMSHGHVHGEGGHVLPQK